MEMCGSNLKKVNFRPVGVIRKGTENEIANIDLWCTLILEYLLYTVLVTISQKRYCRAGKGLENGNHD